MEYNNLMSDFIVRSISLMFGGLGFVFFNLLINQPQELKTAPVILNSPVPTINAIIIQPSPSIIPSPNYEMVKVTKVIDGDTIELENGKHLRYIGIDTPETVDPRKTVQCFGKEASLMNKGLVEGKTVGLEKDVSETDKYDRLLRYVWLDGLLINEILVKEGYAISSTYPPDVKYQQRFINAERIARDNNFGLWSACAVSPTPLATVKLTVTPRPKATPIPTPVYNPPSVINPAPLPVVNPGGNSGGSTGTSGSWSCNCSKTCDSVSSCDEAYYQLRTCGCNKRDGDSDGIPCENICN